MIADKKPLKEIPRTQQYVTRPSLDSIIEKREDKNSMAKSIFEANVRYGYSLKEIGEYIGVHYSTISRVIKRVEKQ